eukprot:TRINITY_DN17541_c0_g1_i1.p2 TRINITY_DN17541_c0_g1~~TRINITY_DN17541_c0_g1_i1.p2  ORF type:complete len:114 (-),score=34.12 TRINITY_DN17541_c0_g1_i1:72-413(-)
MNMPNIFDGLNKLSDNDIIEHVAVLEVLNMSNLSKPIAQKAIKKAVDIINFVGSKIGKDPNIKEPKVKEIWLSLIHISEPTRPLYISYAVFCLKKKKKKYKTTQSNKQNTEQI